MHGRDAHGTGREVTPVRKRLIQVMVSLLALALFVWGACFSQWSFNGERLSEGNIIKKIADGVCLS